jgi:hypothetical protein
VIGRTRQRQLLDLLTLWERKGRRAATICALRQVTTDPVERRRIRNIR